MFCHWRAYWHGTSIKNSINAIEVAAVAKKDLQMEEEIIDLTELIEPGDVGNAKAAAAYAKTAAAPATDKNADPEDDFASIFAATAQETPKKVDPNESLDMPDLGGIDNLLESLDIPPQPREKSAGQAEPADNTHADELDSVLDDLLGTDKPAQNTAPSDARPDTGAKENTAETPDLTADIDDILSSFDESSAPKKPPQKEASPHEGLLNSDLDDILADIKPAQAKNRKHDLDGNTDDLDALLNEAPAAKPAAAAKPAQTAQPLLDDELDALLNEAPAAKPAAAAKPAQTDQPLLDDELDALLNEAPAAKPAAAAKPAQTAQPLLKDDLDDLLNVGAAKPQANMFHPAAAPEMSAAPASTLPAETHEVGAAMPPAQVWSPETLVNLCRNLAAGKDTQENMQAFARELGAQTAHVEEMSAQVSQLSKRLFACESKLAAARARIAALEKGMESAAALEDLLKDGTPLHAGFMALVSSAVANAIKGLSISNNNDAKLLAEMEKLAKADSEAASRLSALEKRLENASPDGSLAGNIENMEARVWSSDLRIEKLEERVASLDSGEAVEKAAAAAVARVLHEEISRLAQG